LQSRRLRFCACAGRPAVAQTTNVHSQSFARGNMSIGKLVMKICYAGPDGFPRRLASGVLVAAASILFCGSAFAQGAIKTKFDAWEYRL